MRCGIRSTARQLVYASALGVVLFGFGCAKGQPEKIGGPDKPTPDVSKTPDNPPEDGSTPDNAAVVTQGGKKTDGKDPDKTEAPKDDASNTPDGDAAPISKDMPPHLKDLKPDDFSRVDEAEKNDSEKEAVEKKDEPKPTPPSDEAKNNSDATKSDDSSKNDEKPASEPLKEEAAPANESKDSGASDERSIMPVSVSPYGTLKDGQKIDLYTLRNTNGMIAKLSNLGAVLVSLEVPDASGKKEDVVLGYADLAGYEIDSNHFGATTGRFCNRIANGKFTLDGKEYTLATNNGPNHLHGGNVGFNKRVWKGVPASDGSASVTFSYLSPDGEENFPGNMQVAVTYKLTDDNRLEISYEASTDKPTICNLTHHSYFNLAGHNSGDMLDHELTINADEYLPCDEGLIPTGKIESVEGTAMDFREAKAIGKEIAEQGEGKKYKILYDLNYVVRKGDDPLVLNATVTDPKSKRTMEVWSDQPGLQFYTANHLDKVAGKGGATYNQYQGLCLETQHYPDSPNQPNFPSTTLIPGKPFRSTTIYAFSWE